MLLSPRFCRGERRRCIRGTTRKSSSRSAAFTLVELVVAFPIILVAAGILLTTIVAVSRERSLASENARVAEAMRAVLEVMRNEELRDVVLLFNADPLDDPDGPGTAPGDRFVIPRLRPVEDSDDGMIGRIWLPMIDVSDAAGLPDWELREDMVAEELGMPRDLDGNGVIDELDHTEDFRILPIVVEAEWQGKLGPRTYRMFTVLTEFRL